MLKLRVGAGPLLDYYPYDQGVPVLCHWRLGDFSRTLLDLTIREPDGAIVGVTLLSFKGLRLPAPPDSLTLTECRAGVPTVGGAVLQSPVFDEPRELSIYIGSENIYLLLGIDVIKPTCLGNDRLWFFVEKERLVALAFGPLSRVEQSEFTRQIDS